MNIYSYQTKSFPIPEEDYYTDSPALILQNLKLHLTSISQFEFLKPYLLQCQCTPVSSSSKLSPYLQYHYLKSKGIDFLYIKQSLLESTDSSKQKLKEVNDKNRDLINEINWIAQEKIDSINEKEQIEQDLELCHLTERERENKTKNPEMNNPKLKKQKIKELKDCYSKLGKEIDVKMNKFHKMKAMNRTYAVDNKIMIEKINQKQIIYDQIVEGINKLKAEIAKHKKLISEETKVKKDSISVRESKKRNKSSGLFKKIFK